MKIIPLFPHYIFAHYVSIHVSYFILTSMCYLLLY